MEQTTAKDELRKKFEDLINTEMMDVLDLDEQQIFDLFWSEIEKREELLKAADDVAHALAKWQTFDARVHSGFRAAELHLNSVVPLEKYQTLKNQK